MECTGLAAFTLRCVTNEIAISKFISPEASVITILRYHPPIVLWVFPIVVNFSLFFGSELRDVK